MEIEEQENEAEQKEAQPGVQGQLKSSVRDDIGLLRIRARSDWQRGDHTVI